MSKRIALSTLIFTLATFALSPLTTAAESEGVLHTYKKATGETFFALSVQAHQQLPAAGAHDILVLFDTSASQIGEYRKDAMVCLDSLLSNLDTTHQVKLMAVDLYTVAMSGDFVAADSEQMKAAISKLNRRAALGSTDMVELLKATAKQFPVDSKNAKSVVYIGDGMSKANLLQIKDYKELVSDLVGKNVSFSSFAIGPQRNIELLAALGNSTGGIIRVDNEDQQTSVKSGFDLAGAVVAPVLWPTNLTTSTGVHCVYAAETTPPIRMDRDTILLGQLNKAGAFEVSISGKVNGQDVQLKWDVAATGSNEDYNFLPTLVENAAPHHGVGLPTLGSEGLIEVRRSVRNNVDGLNTVGLHALRTGDVKGAIEVADEVLRKDPSNTEAKAIKGAAQRGPITTEIALVQDTQPAPAPTTDGNALVLDGSDDVDTGLEDSSSFLENVENERKVLAGKLQAVVENGLEQARDLIGRSPEKAIQELKLLLEQVDSATDVAGDIRQQLRKQIEDAIRETGARQVDVDEQKMLAQSREANAQRLKNLADETARKQELITSLMEKFNVLLDEAALEDDRKRVDEGERYLTADAEIAMPIRVLLPYDGTPTTAVWKARILRQYKGLEKFRDLRHKNFADVMYENEEALIPFPGGDSPIRYPEAEFWHRITVERRKYVTDQGNNPAEQKIVDALDEETVMLFFDQPLTEVVDSIKTRHSIPMIIDDKALADAGLDSSMTVNQDLRGITLRSGLKLMLNSLGLTYVINDEVLKITTPEAAENELIIRTYEVGDLVMPIMSGGGGMMGGGMGMGGGGMGMGGGGMGMGGGGMGGFQVVQDQLILGAKTKAEFNPEPKAVQQTEEVEVPEVIKKQLTKLQVTPKADESIDAAWDRHFSSRKNLEGDDKVAHDRQVRYTVQLHMMQANRLHQSENSEKAKGLVDESIAIMLAAIRNEQSQFWMYEGLGLAMQANHAPIEDVERALMSAVDYSNDEESLLAAGIYMSEVGLHERALKVLRDVSEVNPYRPEPYVRGLALAKRLGDLEALQWASVGVLSQAWTNEQRYVEFDAQRTAEAVILQMKQAGLMEQVKVFGEQLNSATHRDCRVVVSWTGNADIDLFVQEPTGTICSLQNERTTAGGVLLGDKFSIAGQQPVNGYSESYVCPKAFKGEYRLLIRRVWGNVTAGKVTVDIFTDNEDKPHIREQLELDDTGAVVIFDVLHGRRVEPIGAHQLENLLEHQEMVGQALLAQQLHSLSNSDAARDFAISRKMAMRNGRFFLPGRGAVGYRPEITTLPEGAFFSAMAPIVSPDRRYVRVTVPPMPIKMGVGDVRTFNFASGAAQTIEDRNERGNNDGQNGQGGGGNNR
ncbi:MAG: hypothetical protein CMJ76_12155 [Planctomycetaceae bacterium]|nr:hypothetical protein [Planctomycetaceae bacterium]